MMLGIRVYNFQRTKGKREAREYDLSFRNGEKAIYGHLPHYWRRGDACKVIGDGGQSGLLPI
jgi:hypothetical protein